jgi:hypothetical protein
MLLLILLLACEHNNLLFFLCRGRGMVAERAWCLDTPHAVFWISRTRAHLSTDAFLSGMGFGYNGMDGLYVTWVEVEMRWVMMI